MGPPPRGVNDRLELGEGRAGPAGSQPLRALKDFSFYPNTSGQPLEGFELSVTGGGLLGSVTGL